ncbi:substrate-binding periplasmic protein [Nitrincola alkalilacustris]|uniref:substrate-binding periplasmic protein n=1 Tax=Nitrincola alkalilacustris TaxID=1571224 RepID=UPI00124BD310|nr:transporter substrate-binding domain-containing protein [Nitrincola alkalilacustris]
MRVFAVLFALALACPTYAAQTQTDATDATLTFTTADVWPWGYRGPNGEPAGFVADFVAELAQESGLKIDNQLSPHSRALIELSAGQVDLSVLYYSPEMDDIGINLGRVVTVPVLFVTHKSDQRGITFDELTLGHSIGYIRGTYYGEAFASKDDVTRVSVQYLDQAIRMLELGRIDGLLASDRAFFGTLKQLGLDVKDFQFNSIVNQQTAYLYMSHGSKRQDCEAPLREALNQMRSDGRLARIFSMDWGEVE